MNVNLFYIALIEIKIQSPVLTSQTRQFITIMETNMMAFPACRRFRSVLKQLSEVFTSNASS